MTIAALPVFFACSKPGPDYEPDDNGIIVDANGGTIGEGSSVDMLPTLADTLAIDIAGSSIPQSATVSEDGRILTLSHLAADFILSVESDEELVSAYSGDSSLSIEPVPGELNRFRVGKRLFAPNVPAETVELAFVRKGLNTYYPEDVITVRLSANPSVTEGPMDFRTENYSHDFGKYVDNGLGDFILPEGKILTAEFGEEDPWLKVIPEAGRWRVVGGWRPNDPTADGRTQSATLVISNPDGSDREEYTVSRRNFGLPVTWLHGVWWCKYNSTGNSRNFEDQILSSEDPAAAAGQTVFEYLTSCSGEEYADLWGWQYQGDSGTGLRAVESDGKIVMDGFSTTSSAHINRLPPTALAPDGYELPSMEDFNRIFDATDYIWMMWDGSHTLKNPWNGHSRIDRKQLRKNNVPVGSLELSDLIYVGMSSPDYPEHEPLVWYGPGAQWDAEGIQHSGHYNKILFSVYSPDGDGWYMDGSMAGLYLRKNGAGPRDTRVLRFKKSDVEYIY